MTCALHASGLPTEQFEEFVSLYRSVIDHSSYDDRRVFLMELRDGLTRPQLWVSGLLSEASTIVCLNCKTLVRIANSSTLSEHIVHALKENYASEILKLKESSDQEIAAYPQRRSLLDSFRNWFRHPS